MYAQSTAPWQSVYIAPAAVQPHTVFDHKKITQATGAPYVAQHGLIMLCFLKSTRLTVPTQHMDELADPYMWYVCHNFTSWQCQVVVSRVLIALIDLIIAATQHLRLNEATCFMITVVSRGKHACQLVTALHS
jgi:hypothetical protein